MNYTITKKKHDKSGKDIWLVKMSDKVDYTTYKAIESRVKQSGGYYSRFVKSFVFDSEPSTETLNAIFGDSDSGEVIKPVDSSKMAAFNPNTEKYTTIRRDIIRDEFKSGKLLAAQYETFDGMTDMRDYIRDEDLVWHEYGEKGNDRFDESVLSDINSSYNTASAYGGQITMGWYKFKYKDGIELPKLRVEPVGTSLDYYTPLKGSVLEGDFKLDYTDSNKLDCNVGDKVIYSYDGLKYCGEIIDKKINTTTSTYYGNIYDKTVVPVKKEEKSATYKVKLNNGVITEYGSFILSDDCESEEPMGIIFDEKVVFPQHFWNDEIVRRITSLKSWKVQKSKRKNESYRIQDQKYIDSREKDLMERNMPIWLGWEYANMDYARKITGETKEQQETRISNWENKLGVKKSSAGILYSHYVDKELEKINKQKQALLKSLEFDRVIEQKGYKFPVSILKYAYKLIKEQGVDEAKRQLNNSIAIKLSGDRNKSVRKQIIDKISDEKQSDFGIRNLERLIYVWLEKTTDAFESPLLSDEAKEIIKPEWDKMKDFIEKTDTEINPVKSKPDKDAIEKRLRGLKLINNPEFEKRIRGLELILKNM